MKKHNGMRPHDIVILLKIAAIGDEHWRVLQIAHELGISQSEVSESLHRSKLAGLLAADKKTLMRAALLEFLQYGLPYVYPQRPGPIVRGMPTAHSAPPLNEEILSDEIYVWSYAKGTTRGQSIEPLHKSVPEASERDFKLYELLTLCDAMRVGRVREKMLAVEELRNRIHL